MKKYICFAAALAIVGSASCNKELVDNNAPEVPEVKITTLTATIGEPDTKTTLAAPEDAHTSGSAVHWAAEDALSVFDGASNVKYTIKTEDDVDYTPAATAVFEGTALAEAEGYYALYPYTSTASLAEGVIKGAVLPATQTAVAGNIPADAALAVAYTEDRETIYFKNVATIIGFTLTEAAEKVEFVAKGDEEIAGTIDVTINDGLTTYTVQEETGSNKVTLNNLEAGTYYFTILPDVTLTQGYEFYIGEELAKSNDSELHLVRSKVYSLGEVKVPLKDRELSFSPASYEITWGDDFTEPTLNGKYTEVTYSSDNEEVATVDEATGEVTLSKAGTVTITATVAADETYNAGSAEYTLIVNKAARTISFSSKNVTMGDDAKFVEPELSNVTKTDVISYTSSNPETATVDANGNVSRKKDGTVTITANVEETDTHNSCSASYTIVVLKESNWKIMGLTSWNYADADKMYEENNMAVAKNVKVTGEFKLSNNTNWLSVDNLTSNILYSHVGNANNNMKIESGEYDIYISKNLDWHDNSYFRGFFFVVPAGADLKDMNLSHNCSIIGEGINDASLSFDSRGYLYAKSVSFNGWFKVRKDKAWTDSWGSGGSVTSSGANIYYNGGDSNAKGTYDFYTDFNKVWLMSSGQTPTL